MVKKSLALLLAGVLLWAAVPAALGAPEGDGEAAPADRNAAEESLCGTAPQVMEDLFSSLLSKKAAQLGQEAEVPGKNRASMPNWPYATMPSTGQVHLLVIPVAYPDYPDYKERFDPQQIHDQFFAPYVPDQPMWEQSVRAFYYQSSYGALDLTGTVLPVYDAPQPSGYYEERYTETIADLVVEALNYQLTLGLDLSQYDSDGDGILDGVILKSLRPEDLAGSGSAGWHYVNAYRGTSLVGGYKIKTYMYSVVKEYESALQDSRGVYKHELGHLLGLPDHYAIGLNRLPANTEDLMRSYNYYINAYYKYLLDWIDPVILTVGGDVKSVALSSVEPLEIPGGLEQPRAAVLVPHKEEFPFGEFFMAEYRAGGFDFSEALKSFYTQNPSVVIWHCDTATYPSDNYINGTGFLKPVHKSGTTSYDERDVYFAGDEFSQDTDPASTFYTGAQSGAYLKVNALDPQYAMLKMGFIDPGPQIVLSDYDDTAIRSGGWTRFTLSYTDGWKPLSPDNEFFHREGGLKYTVVRTSETPGEPKMNVTLEDIPGASDRQRMVISGRGISGGVGEGTIRIDIPAGEIQSNGRASPAVSSLTVYVDDTPPVLTLLGDDPMTIARGEKFEDPGVWIMDNLDPELREGVVDYASLNEIVEVDIDTPGTYTVAYSYRDHAGNWSEEVTRTVIVDPHSHSYGEDWRWDEERHWRECTECGAQKEAAAHGWDGGKQTLAPTEDEPGLKLYTCTTCGATKTEVIPALVTYLRTAQDLWRAAAEINAGNTSGHYKLTADIDLGGELWTPIRSFSGTFDGNGHRITGLRVHVSTGHGGLFASIGSEGTVQNLGISGEVIGDSSNSNVGGIAYMNQGTIRNCYNACCVTGEANCGGIVAANVGVIENCYNIGPCKYVGTMTGHYVGGIAGTNLERRRVVNCYNYAPVTGGKAQAGSVVGTNRGTVEHCYYLSGTAEAGIASGSGTGEAKEGSAEQFSAAETFAGWDLSEVWLMSDTLGRPILRAVMEPGGHSHSYSSEWRSDSAGHWYECQCGDRAEEGAHVPVDDPAVAPTCDTEGRSAGRHCDVCGFVLRAGETLPALGHEFSEQWLCDDAGHRHVCSRCGADDGMALHIENDGVVTVNPTLEAEGVRTYSCTVCGYIMRTQVLPKLEPEHTHSYGTTWLGDETGHWHECVCGEESDRTAHDPAVDPAIPATCTTAGKTEGIHCGTCGYVMKAQQTVAAAGHEFSDDWAGDEARHWHACSRCDAVCEEADHVEDDGTVTTEPTLEAEGVRTYSCTVCGHVMRTQALPKLEPEHTHSYGETWEFDAGSHWHVCGCGAVSDMAAHVWDGGVETTAPTSTRKGVRTYTCTVCAGTRTEEIPATGGGGGSGGSSGSSGDEERVYYTISVSPESEGGSVKADPQRAAQGGSVKLIVRAEPGYVLERLTARTGSGKELSLKKEEEGGYAFTMPSSQVTVEARFIRESPQPEQKTEHGPEKTGLPFTDVKEKAWYYDAVEAVYNKGLMVGVTKTQFKPEITASRGMVVTMLCRMEGGAAAGNGGFSDVPEGAYYASAVAWAAQQGLVKGYRDGTFRPDAPITREELAVILFRYETYKGRDTMARADLSGFNDGGQTSKYAQDAVSWANASGVLTGTDWGDLCPGDWATRAEIAVMMERLLALDRE